MLDPEFLGDLPDSVVDMWHAVETDLLCDIAKRINNSNYLIPSSVWNLNKLKDLGLHQDYINEKLSQATKKSKEEIEKIMADAFRQGLRHDNEIIKRGLGKLDDIVVNGKSFNPIASAGIKAVNNEIKNFTKTYAARLSQKYEWSIDKAFLNVQSGYMTPEQATKRAIEELFLHNDLPDLVTQKGRHEQLSTVVARAIRTGTNQSMAKIQIENCKDLDCDLVEVSSHYGARPTHAEWQGQIYSLSGKHDKYADFVKSTGYGGVDGLCGINCRHSFYPYFEGLSTKSFERIDPKENQKYFELKGKEKTLKNRIKHLTKKNIVLKSVGVESNTKMKLDKVKIDLSWVQKEIEDEKRKNRETAINREKINSSEYRKAFDKLGLDVEQTRKIYVEAKRILEHRNKTLYEDLLYLNVDTGEFVVQRGYDVERKVEPTKGMRKLVTENPLKIVAMHNHPSSLPPSSADINSCFKQKYKFGIILGHDGTLIKYEVEDRIRLSAYNLLLAKYEKNKYTIDELISEAKKQGVVLEVLFK